MLTLSWIQVTQTHTHAKKLETRATHIVLQANIRTCAIANGYFDTGFSRCSSVCESHPDVQEKKRPIAA
jgi:hypothetical protein